jgi:hypothetical protein
MSVVNATRVITPSSPAEAVQAIAVTRLEKALAAVASSMNALHG